MKHLITADGIGKTYESNGLKTIALHDVSFNIEEGSFNVILGPSGAGKTTLLNLLGGMDFLTTGSLKVDLNELYGLSKRELTLYRRNDVGFVFQFYNLMPNLTALENVELAIEVCKNAYSPKEIIDKVGLSHRRDSFPAQLSGGEQQRVSIARAIAKNPKLLLCDEPTGALDYETGKEILRLLRKLCNEERKTIIIVTHNSALKDMGDHVLSIKNGTIVKDEFNPHPKSIEEIEW